MPHKYSDSDVTRIAKSEKFPRMVRARIKGDATMKRLQVRYLRAIRRRVHAIEKMCARELDRDVRRAFLLNLKRAGVRVMPQETHRF